ncbi:period circadian protein homolog 1b isoform X2 [Anguilla anguilla]|uniref:period circadian protein homolog 1b isoform X2 n=1 Tax=Anguilla anguilla TaxID=7936 RepID=UPI0015B200C4|nr:period circadian protein homolog 1b isoform X2 [Anguilla anguilla]
MSDDNSDSAPGSDMRGGMGGAEELSGQQALCSELIGGPSLEAKSAGASPGATGALRSPRDRRAPNSDDTDGLSSGNDSGERESEGGGRRQSTRSSSHSSSSHNGKDSAMILETTESNKSSNSQSPSPPSSSVAYSLLSASSEQDHPSTSGCSSEQSARLQTQKELSRALKELKIRVPLERWGKGCSSTLAALKYALNCVKQVRANQEYYHQWNVEDSHGCSLDLSTFTFEELDNITSEYTLKNTDTFSMAVSFLSGKVVYISPHGSSLLRGKLELLQGALFSELLAPQDVSTFYSGTAPCRLPHWPTCMDSAASPMDCAEEKSMFCRISGGGREFEGGARYHPFRLTPYQLTLRDSDACDPQPCCLLIAERVHSGYEAPRIPPDKRVFTTSHTPSCLFQEVDERAVPLLGYLPQDLVGAPVLLYLHPDDRPVMVAIHKKILQFAGQPFDHSPLRLCARSGEYLTIDTSWSSFVNPWSRKVAFIVGRHKVRTSPLNEDVFTPPRGGEEGRAVVPEVQQLSEQIHRLLLQPSHCATGGAHEYPGNGSSSDSAVAVEDPARPHRPMTFQQMCKDVHVVKSNGQQVFIDSRSRPPHRKHPSAEGTLKVADTSKPTGDVTKQAPAPQNPVTPPAPPVRKESTTPYSYQQINCLDSIIRYLESCNVPNTVKRKCASSSGAASSTSDDDKQKESGTPKGAAVALGADPAPLPPLALHPKAESVMSVTSQCSFSSTIVHVGDKKPPESDIVMEDAPPTPTPTPALPSNLAPPTAAPPPSAPPAPAAPAAPEREGRRGCAGCVGLTKEVLLAHTQQEEVAFLGRFQDLSRLRVLDPAPGPAPYAGNAAQRGHTAAAFNRGVRSSRDYPTVGSSGRRRGRGGKRLKHQETSDQGSSLGAGAAFLGPLGGTAGRAEGPLAASVPPHPQMSMGPQTSSSSWPNSVGSQASLPSVPYHPGVLPLYPLYPPLAPPMPHPAVDVPNPDPSLRYPLPSAHLAPPLGPPMVAFVLPNYIFPQPSPPVPQPNTPIPQPNLQISQPNPQIPQPSFPVSSVPQNFYNPDHMFPFPRPAAVAPAPLLPPGTPSATPRAPSRSSTPQSCGQAPPERDGTASPLFQSRCSSPLNLLQLEESPSNRLEVASALVATQQATPPLNGAAQDWTAERGGVAGGKASANRSDAVGDGKENEPTEANESSNQDAMSTSSDLLDLLLQEDSRSGTGSAASASGSSGSGSNGCSMTESGTRSSQSSHTSKYFGSIDSSENDHSRKQAAGGAGEEQFIKCVLQDPIWLLMANADEKVMMTYQLPVRDREQVLWEDRRALRSMQKQQPRFTEQQKRELSQVHPWIRTGRLPPAIDIQVCVGCGSAPSVPEATPFDVHIHDMELGGAIEPPLPESARGKALDGSAPAPTSAPAPPESAMEEEEEGGGAPPETSDQEMRAEEQEVTSRSDLASGLAV